MIDLGFEFFSIDPIVNAGHRTGYFHTTFKRHPITSGDPIQLEFGACYHRYTAPVMRTVLTAEPIDLQKRMIDVQMATLETLYSSIRAGRSTGDIANEAMAVIGPLKDEIVRSGHFGYSVGLGFPPTWTDGPAYLSGAKNFELKTGMTFHTPNAWRIPKEFVIGTSETIVVTDTGCEILTSQERNVPVKLLYCFRPNKEHLGSFPTKSSQTCVGLRYANPTYGTGLLVYCANLNRCRRIDS